MDGTHDYDTFHNQLSRERRHHTDSYADRHGEQLQQVLSGCQW
jgi:hypothetical protein